MRRGLVIGAQLALVACVEPTMMGDGDAGAGGDGAVALGPPRPYVPPAEGAPECELSADCPEGTYCDLGECIQECHVADPCTETGASTCLPRGRCAESADAPSDPPPSDVSIARVVAGVDVLNVGAGEAMAMLAFAAEPADEEVRYRVVSRVPWLRVREVRGTFTGALAVSFEVDREGLAVGVHTGSVVLRTTAGDVTVPVQLTQSLTGVYQGELRYETPRELGAVPLRIELFDRGGFVDVRVLADESPTFPRAGGAQATSTASFSGSASSDGAQLDGSIVQSFRAAELGEGSVIARDVGRDLHFMLSPTASGGLEGTFSERWVGLFPAGVEVGGSLVLARTEDAPRDFTTTLPGALPPNPSARPLAIDAACTAAAGDAVLGCSGRASSVACALVSGCTWRGSACVVATNPCGASATPAQLRACGDALLEDATAFEGAPLVVAGSMGTTGYDAVSALCEADVANAALERPSMASAACFHEGNHLCALTLLEHAAERGDSAAAGLVSEAVARRAGLGMLLLNEQLVEAFEAPFRSRDAGVERIVEEALDEGRGYSRDALAQLFAPHVLEALRHTSPSVAAANDYRGLRLFAQLVARDRLAASEATSLRIRTRPAERPEARDELHAQALDLLLGLVALSTIERAEEAPASPELGLFAEALTELGRRSLQAGERIDPLGLPAGFVPFVYEPSAMGANNYDQVSALFMPIIATAVAEESAATGAVRAFESSEDSLRRELESVADQIGRRQADICGPGDDAFSGNVEHCGEGGVGELAEALAVHAEAVNAIDIAHARFDGLLARAQIQRTRAATVRGIRQDSIEFLSRTNEQINAREVESIVIEAAQTALALAAQAQVWNGGASVAMGVASGLLEGLQGHLRLVQQQLRQAQELRVREDEANVEYLNAMFALQEMLVGQAELALEITQATLRAVTASVRIATLRSEVVQLDAERVVLEERATGGLLNDPAFRVLRSRAIEQATQSRDSAIVGAYLMARAFEFETNTEFAAIETMLVPALRADEVQRFTTCLAESTARFRTAYGPRQSFTDEVSLREDVLGIRGPIVDEVTGETITEAEQFRRLLLAPSNLGPDGSVELRFATSLNPGNGLFSTRVCNDQIRTLQVRLIGDGLGDDQARVTLVQGGASTQRGCESGRGGGGDVLRSYELAARTAEVQAGVNVPPTSVPDTQFAGRSVAASEWRLVILPGRQAPANADLDVTRIDDIVFRIEHQAISLTDSPVSYAPACGG
ncbi:MAG: hypothetical protein SFX73_08625 [Kofleriaceae bacterium]|nr:hypothetical protein [Kofleriaceae bacterium]